MNISIRTTSFFEFNIADYIPIADIGQLLRLLQLPNMKVTKAVIAAGGWSTRFLPAVKAYAKQLVPILDKSQIQIVIEELIGAGITDIAIVHRDGETSLQTFFAPDPELKTYLETTNKTDRMTSFNQMISSLSSLVFFPQTKSFPYGNGTPIIIAKEFIGSDPFVYLWGDDLTIESTPGHFLQGAINVFDQYHPAAVECVQAMPTELIHLYGTVKYVDDPVYPHRISALLEKLPASQAPSNIIQGGRFVVDAKIIKILEQTQTARGELWFADAINYLAQNDIVLTHNYTENNARWTTTGDPLNWLKTNISLALQDPRFSNEIKNFLKEQASTKS